MAGRELKKLRRELSDAAMIYTMAGAGLSSLQAGQAQALAETEHAVRRAIVNARSAGYGAEADAMLVSADSHKDFLGQDKTEWLAFLGRLTGRPTSAPRSPNANQPGPANRTAEPIAPLAPQHREPIERSQSSPHPGPPQHRNPQPRNTPQHRNPQPRNTPQHRNSPQHRNTPQPQDTSQTRDRSQTRNSPRHRANPLYGNTPEPRITPQPRNTSQTRNSPQYRANPLYGNAHSNQPDVPIRGAAASRPSNNQSSSNQASSNQSVGSLIAGVAIVLVGSLVVGPWIVNKVLTRTSADIGRCYESLVAISGGQFDEVDCNDPSAMKLFATGSVGELRTSRSCPNTSLTIIIDRPDTAYCLAPPYLG